MLLLNPFIRKSRLADAASLRIRTCFPVTIQDAMKFNWRGYTYNDEMRNSAILQLTYVGLRFNEAKSANPFAYYTAAITNSFCRVLNSEKRNQNIRDDILEMNGLKPSTEPTAKIIPANNTPDYLISRCQNHWQFPAYVRI